MEIIDPNYLMSTIPVSSNCPKDITFMVRWIKGMMMWNDADLERDKEIVITFFFEWANNWSPQHNLWNAKISKEKVTKLYERAKEWIQTADGL